MLEEITIENLGVIGRAHLPLCAGLTAITGETGAGKTMLLTGLSLLMGEKADSSRVRSGAEQAAVEGRIGVPPESSVRHIVTEAGGSIDDDDTLVVLRTVAAQGRSRAHLGGRSVPQALLGEVAAEFVTVHGQAEQLRLRSPSRQRRALDEFLGPQHEQILSKYRECYAARQQTSQEIEDLEARATERAREAELLRLGLAEVERIEPQPGEDAALVAEISLLSNIEDIRRAVAGVHSALSGDELDMSAGPTAIDLVESARRDLETVSTHDDALADLLARISEIGYLLSDVATEASGYLAKLAADPQRLDQAQQRLAELATLTRSYGSTIDEVLEWASDAGLRLIELDGGGERLESLRAREQEQTAELIELGEQLSSGRQAGAGELEGAVTAELAGLAMAGAQFLVQVESDSGGLGPWGGDQVAMSLVPHPGAPASPLGQGASGGELSRVMLAIEVALAHRHEAARGAGGAVPTFVFDEVDAGVGGRAALEVGRRLAELARSAQVIVVTHLAQVAAFADQQIVVSKSDQREGSVITQSDVRVVTGDDRVTELARMLSGQQDSAAARQHAAELLESAVVG